MTESKNKAAKMISKDEALFFFEIVLGSHLILNTGKKGYS